MIANDFIYACPESKEEAANAYTMYLSHGITPMYYGGGSEVITMSRAGSISPGAVIDLKGVPECNKMGVVDDYLIIGGCVTLRAIKDSNIFPLLGAVCGRIADHTNQCRITLGGNLCSTIIYRETAQVLLVTEADIILHSTAGTRILPIAEVFNRRMMLNPGEFILQVRIPMCFTRAPFNHVKKTGSEKIDYPLISISTLQHNGYVRMALSGYYEYPFRDTAIEQIFNKRELSNNERINLIFECLKHPPINDYQGSAEYRRFALKRILCEMIEVWG